MLNLAGALSRETTALDIAAQTDLVREYAASIGALKAGAPEVSVGLPVTFGNCVGQLYPAEGPVAVLMLGAIGYEEMCVRTTWRALAERLQANDVPCLRFDYPGVGDSPDAAEPAEGLADWLESIRAAARFLRWATGRERIAIVGQGLGGALAARIARELEPVEATVFMAPVTSGRIYLRELSLWARVLTDRIGITPDPDDAGGYAVAGISLDSGRAAAIKAIDLSKLDLAPSPKALVVGRVNHGGDERLGERLASLGVATERVPYEVLDAVAEWVAALGADLPNGSFLPRRAAPIVVAPAPTQGVGFRERPIRFGPEDRKSVV